MSQIVFKNAGIVKPTALSYLWHVNFTNACEKTKNVGDYLISPAFSSSYSANKQEWQLHLFPRGDRKKDYISIYVNYLGQSNVSVNITISLLHQVCYKAKTINFTHLFEPQSFASGFSEFADHAFITDRRNNIITNNTISILCEINYLTVPFSNEPIEDRLPDYARLKEFDDFEKLLEAENTADVTVVMGEDKIKVHKAIIMSRSPVFQAMFEHDMREKEENNVEIVDVKYEVMKEVFRFMYAGKVKGIEKIAGNLFVAADKYCITGLKVLCQKQLLQTLTIANAIVYLKLAERCNANNLKSRIVKFIVRNAKDIVHKPELKQLPVEIVCEVLSAVVNNPANK